MGRGRMFWLVQAPTEDGQELPVIDARFWVA
jgi:hypothetical protein